MKKIILIFLLSFIALNVNSVQAADVFYVRTDGGPGGTTSTGCSGLVDAAFTGSNGPDCAFNHPNWPLPATNGWSYIGEDTTYAVSSSGTVVIHGSEAGTGVYRMGCQGDPCTDADLNYVRGAGTAFGEMGYIIVPNGVEGADTLVVGCSVDGCGTGELPELWLAGRLGTLFRINEASHIEWKDIEITDHDGADSECSQSTSSLCGRTAFYSEDSDYHDLTWSGMDVHGLTQRAMIIGGPGIGGSNANLLFQDSNFDGNKWAGIDLDTCGNDGTCGITGDVVFRRVNMRWNGCSEAYPVVEGGGVTGRLPTVGSCREGNNGGYGDMLGSSRTGGHWLFEDCNFSHNASDAIDLLYMHTDYGSMSLIVKRTLFEGNNGNSIKGALTLAEDNMIIGNCMYIKESVYDASGFGSCRAAGDPFAIQHNNTTPIQIYSNTIVSSGDNVILSSGSSCYLDIKNNNIVGGYDYHSQISDPVAFHSAYDSDGNVDCLVEKVLDTDHNICWDGGTGAGFKGTEQCDGVNDQSSDPEVVGPVLQGDGGTYTGFFEDLDYVSSFYLLISSNAIDNASSSFGDSIDYNSFPKGTLWDIGGVDYGSVPTGGPTPYCGDSNVDSGEDCDTLNLDGESCVTQGFDLGGTLACSSCVFDTTGCASSLCGNDVVEGTEECDDGGTVNGDGCDAFCYWESTVDYGINMTGSSLVGGGIN